MRLSEAINIGSTFRGETHVPCSPFIRVANSDELLSDVWGAACEAVFSPIAKRNWDKANESEYRSDIAALKEIQEKYFAEYFKSPAVCPGAKERQVAKGGGRFTGRVVGGLNEFIVERERYETYGGITTVCPAIANLAELTEHMFYVHNWTRGDCAEAIGGYEQYGSTSIIERYFEHYRDNALMKQAAQRLTAAAVTRHQQRLQRKSYFLSQ